MIKEFLRPDIFDLIYNKLTLTNKLDIFEVAFSKDQSLKKKYAPFVSFVRKLNSEIRNNMFHCKLDQLSYNGEILLRNIKSQRGLVKDMFSYLRDSKKQ